MDGAAWTGRHGRGRPGRRGAPAVKMSVGGSTVVFVTRPTVIARAADGHGYGQVPPARPELALARTATAPLEVAQLDLPQVNPSPVALANLDVAQLEFAVIDLETTGWSPGT